MRLYLPAVAVLIKLTHPVGEFESVSITGIGAAVGITNTVVGKSVSHSRRNRRPSAYKRHFSPPLHKKDSPFTVFTRDGKGLKLDRSEFRISPCYAIHGFSGPQFTLLNGFQTAVYHTPVSDYWGGSGVTAFLTPWDYRSMNSDADASAIGCMHDLGLTQRGWITGHLLNAELGGPGNEPRNLTPLDSAANHLHLTTTETPIKEFLNCSRTHTENEELDHFYGVKYTVEVLRNGDIPYGIRCKARLWRCTFRIMQSTRTSLMISEQVLNQEEVDGTPARDFLGDLLSTDGILITNQLADPRLQT